MLSVVWFSMKKMTTFAILVESAGPPAGDRFVPSFFVPRENDFFAAITDTSPHRG
jgi:hypothetical protein